PPHIHSVPTRRSSDLIGDGGKLFHSAIGVWIGQSPDNCIIHCEIYDFFYTGISIGWTWGYGPALASNNVVEFNHIHHIGVKSDGDRKSTRLNSSHQII